MAIKLADTLAPMADFPAVEAKDVAFNDNKSLQEKYDNGELGGGTSGGVSSADIENHNNSETAHPSILSQINEIKSRILALETAGGTEVTANPFAVTFGNLDGITANAVWNADEARLEF